MSATRSVKKGVTEQMIFTSTTFEEAILTFLAQHRSYFSTAIIRKPASWSCRSMTDERTGGCAAGSEGASEALGATMYPPHRTPLVATRRLMEGGRRSASALPSIYVLLS